MQTACSFLRVRKSKPTRVTVKGEGYTEVMAYGDLESGVDAVDDSASERFGALADWTGGKQRRRRIREVLEDDDETPGEVSVRKSASWRSEGGNDDD